MRDEFFLRLAERLILTVTAVVFLVIAGIGVLVALATASALLFSLVNVPVAGLTLLAVHLVTPPLFPGHSVPLNEETFFIALIGTMAVRMVLSRLTRRPLFEFRIGQSMRNSRAGTKIVRNRIV